MLPQVEDIEVSMRRYVRDVQYPQSNHFIDFVFKSLPLSHSVYIDSRNVRRSAGYAPSLSSTWGSLDPPLEGWYLRVFCYDNGKIHQVCTCHPQNLRSVFVSVLL
jgi:hypothetical protein